MSTKNNLLSAANRKKNDVLSAVNRWLDEIEDSSSLKFGLLALAVVLVIALPFVLNSYSQRVVSYILVAIVLATGYNIIGGFAGYASFGHAMFIGMGAYTSAILMNTYGVPFLLTIPIGCAIGTAFALLVGPPVLRLRGHYFAIATLGLQLSLMRLMTSVDFFGGGTGWPTFVRYDADQFYFLFLTLAVLSLVFVWRVKHSRFGFGLRALSLNEDQAEMIGIPTTRYKTAAFGLSAMLPAAVGAVYAGWLNFINVHAVFSVDMSVNMILYVLLGGVGTLWGPVVGAVVLESINQVVWARFPNLHVLVYGFIIVFIVLFLPGGLMQVLKDFRDR